MLFRSILTHFPKRNIVFPAMVIFVVVVGMAGVFTAMSGESAYYSQSELNAIRYLGTHAVPGSSVLAMWDQGHVLAYYTHLPVVIDGYFEFAHELEARNNAMRTAWQTGDCVTFRNAMDSFHARYFYLSSDELRSEASRLGVLELKSCTGVHTLYSSDGARIIERIPSSTS